MYPAEGVRCPATATRVVVLVDTSVWIAHLRERQAALADLLVDGRVLLHSFVAGELACGNLRKRAAILAALTALPVAMMASDNEVMHLVENRKLWRRGPGWIDAHLLASALVSVAASGRWTSDWEWRHPSWPWAEQISAVGRGGRRRDGANCSLATDGHGSTRIAAKGHAAKPCCFRWWGPSYS